MKKIVLFAMKPWVYLTIIPLLLLLILTISVHPLADGLYGFYPLEIALGGGSAVIFLFFFRTVSISFEELSKFAVFQENERDRVLLSVGNEVILTLRGRGYIGIDAYGLDRTVAQLDWLRDVEPTERYFFRSKALGGTSTAVRILRNFGVDAENARHLAAQSDCSMSFEFVSVSTATVNEMHEIRIKLIKEYEIDE